MNYLERVREIKQVWNSKQGVETTKSCAKSVLSAKSPSEPNALSDNLLSRLQTGSYWLTAQHQAWLEVTPNAVSDERFSMALAAWGELERPLRLVFGYDGCVFGPDRRCPEDAPAVCDFCVEVNSVN